METSDAKSTIKSIDNQTIEKNTNDHYSLNQNINSRQSNGFKKLQQMMEISKIKDFTLLSQENDQKIKLLENKIKILGIKNQMKSKSFSLSTRFSTNKLNNTSNSLINHSQIVFLDSRDSQKQQLSSFEIEKQMIIQKNETLSQINKELEKELNETKNKYLELQRQYQIEQEAEQQLEQSTIMLLKENERLNEFYEKELSRIKQQQYQKNKENQDQIIKLQLELIHVKQENNKENSTSPPNSNQKIQSIVKKNMGNQSMTILKNQQNQKIYISKSVQKRQNNNCKIQQQGEKSINWKLLSFQLFQQIQNIQKIIGKNKQIENVFQKQNQSRNSSKVLFTEETNYND